MRPGGTSAKGAMIQTDADLTKLSHRQREVLGSLAGRLLHDQAKRFLRVGLATTKINEETLRHLITRSESLMRQAVTQRPLNETRTLREHFFDVRAVIAYLTVALVVWMGIVELFLYLVWHNF